MKLPAATRSPFGSAATACTLPLAPLPNAAHTPLAGSKVAMPLATTLPAVANEPPTTSRGGNGPAPSRSHIAVPTTAPSTPGAPMPASHCGVHWAVRGSVQARNAVARTTGRITAMAVDSRAEG